MDYPIQSSGQLSSHLRALRKAKGLSQQQLGAMLGVRQTRIARIEADPASIRVEQLLGLLSALAVQLILRPKAGQAGAVSGSRTPAPSRVSSRGRKRRGESDEPW